MLLPEPDVNRLLIAVFMSDAKVTTEMSSFPVPG
jgi:hypothetical protein